MGKHALLCDVSRGHILLEEDVSDSIICPPLRYVLL